MRKKGSVSIQFNWIFVLVAGLILAGTVSFIGMQSSLSRKQVSAKTFESIKTFIAGAYVSKGKSIQLPIDGIKMNYDETQLSIDGISETEYLLFAPHEIQGYHLMIWSQSLEMPFLVSNVAFMTTNNVRYIIVYDNSNPSSVRLKDEINNSFDNRTSITFVSNLNTIQDENNYLVIIAYLDVPLNTNVPSMKGEILGVEVKPDNNNVTGALNFYSYSSHSNTGSSVFLNPNMVTGAIVSGDFPIYNANVKQIFLRTSAVANILAQKAITLKGGNSDPNLNVRYDQAFQRLKDIESISLDLYKNPGQLSSVKEQLLEKIYDLNVQNKKLFMKSSPIIY